MGIRTVSTVALVAALAGAASAGTIQSIGAAAPATPVVSTELLLAAPTLGSTQAWQTGNASHEAPTEVSTSTVVPTSGSASLAASLNVQLGSLNRPASGGNGSPSGAGGGVTDIPIPLPSTGALAGLGLLVVGARRRRAA